MTVDDIISGVRVLIPYDYNQTVRETLYPIDAFVRKALGDALTELTSEGMFLEKSIFIPLITGENIYDLTIDTFTKNKFAPTNPKQVALFPYPSVGTSQPTSQFSTLPITTLTGLFDKTELETDTLQATLRNLGTQYSLILSQSPGAGSVTSGSFGKITAIDRNANTIETNATTSAGQIVVNLEFADRFKYESGTIVTKVGNLLTLSNDIDTKWNLDDRLFVASGTPTLIHIIYNGITTAEYFVSNSDVVPMRDILRPEIEGLVMKNLFKYLAVRMPEMMKVYNGLVQSKLIMDSNEIIRSARGKIEKNVITPGYIPFTEYYGR